MMSTPEERLAALRGLAGECGGGGEDELLRLLHHDKHRRPVCLAGFEPAAVATAAEVLGAALRAQAAARAGCRVRIVVGDLIAFLNKKMGGGEWGAIRAAARRNAEVLEAALRALKVIGGGGGGEVEVEVLLASDEVRRRAGEYWGPLVMDVAQRFSVSRVLMGRKENKLWAGQFLSTVMQCADVFFYQADICHMAMDQREVNLLARDYCEASGRQNKPIILSYEDMLPGLKEGQRISNSDPSSAIFMEDDEFEVNKKINKAFCPPGIVEANPCLEYIKHIVLPWSGNFVVIRAEAGGNKTYNEVEELFEDYRSGALHPADVKANLKKAINQILQSVRDNLIHFERNNDSDELKSVKSTPSTVDDLLSRMPAMTLEKRFEILHSIAQECQTENELKQLLQEKTSPICYDGFEPSGRMHIAQGVGKAINIDKRMETLMKMLGIGFQLAG
ncbi:unnamed protein product [Urochloa humidicola]